MLRVDESNVWTLLQQQKSDCKKITWNFGELGQHMWGGPCLHKSRELLPWNHMGQHPHFPHPLRNMGRGRCIHWSSHKMCYQSAKVGSNCHLNLRTRVKIRVLLVMKLMMMNQVRKVKAQVKVDQQACSKLLPCNEQAPRRACWVFLIKALQLLHPDHCKLSLVSSAWYHFSLGLSSLTLSGSWLECLALLENFAIAAAKQKPPLVQANRITPGLLNYKRFHRMAEECDLHLELAKLTIPNLWQQLLMQVSPVDIKLTYALGSIIPHLFDVRKKKETSWRISRQSIQMIL